MRSESPSVRWTADQLRITPRLAAGLLRAGAIQSAEEAARWANAPAPGRLAEVGIRASLTSPAGAVDITQDDGPRTALGWRTRIGWERTMAREELTRAAAAWWPWAAHRSPPAFLCATVAGGFVVGAWRIAGIADVQPRGGRMRFALDEDSGLAAHFEGTRLDVRPGPIAAPIEARPNVE